MRESGDGVGDVRPGVRWWQCFFSGPVSPWVGFGQDGGIIRMKTANPKIALVIVAAGLLLVLVMVWWSGRCERLLRDPWSAGNVGNTLACLSGSSSCPCSTSDFDHLKRPTRTELPPPLPR